MQRFKKHTSFFFISGHLLFSGILLLFLPSISSAQNDTVAKRARIAVFSPLYLDSAFDALGAYRHGKTLPKYFTAGLDFFEGVQLAIDSLQKEKAALDIYVYDTRSPSKKLEAVLAQEEIKNMDLLLGYVNVNEASQLARAAASLEIPFINVNLPNDAGVKGNPDYIILNPTLGTHCNAIYKFLQKNYALAPIFYFRKKGTMDDQLKKYFADAEKNSASVPLKIKYITLEDTVTANQLKRFIDSTKTNICLAGSLDANFGLSLARQLASLKKSYKSTVIGMPFWDNIDFSKPAFRGVEIIYSSPRYVNADSKLVQQLNNHFATKHFSKTSDIVFSGFESLYYFSHILSDSADNFIKRLSTQKKTIFGEIDIQPVTNKQTGEPEYYENKKLYFIKKADGVIKSVN